MTRTLIEQTVLDAGGNVLPSVPVHVYQRGTTVHITDQLYADSTSGITLANPLTSDANGNIAAWVDVPGTDVPAFVDLGWSDGTARTKAIRVDLSPLQILSGSVQGAGVVTDPIWDAAGDLALGTGADTAARLAITIPAANILNVLGVVNGETTWSVKPVHDSTAPVTQAFGDAASAGTALTAAHRDHRHGMPAASYEHAPTWSRQGSLAVMAGTFRWYNDTGRTLTIVAVRVAVGTVPTGATVIIDVNIDGTTIYTTQGNRPVISSLNSVKSTNYDVTTIADGHFFTVDVDQVGSSIIGADLTVTVLLRG